MLRHTGADALMIGRAAQGRPWIFREIAHFLATGAHLPPPTVAEARALIVEHLADHYAFYGEVAGVRIARKHLGWYTEALAGGAAFRREANAAMTAGEQLAAVRALLRSARSAVRSASTIVEAGTTVRGAAATTVALPTFTTNNKQCEPGKGGPRRVTRKIKLNGSNEICRSVEQSLDEYFRRLDGETPTGVYDMVIGHVERALLVSIMDRAQRQPDAGGGHAGHEPQHAALEAHPVQAHLMAATVAQALLSVSDKTGARRIRARACRRAASRCCPPAAPRRRWPMPACRHRRRQLHRLSGNARRPREDAASEGARRHPRAARPAGARRGAGGARHPDDRPRRRQSLSVSRDGRQARLHAGRRDREHRHRRSVDGARRGEELAARRHRRRSGRLRGRAGRTRRATTARSATRRAFA